MHVHTATKRLVQKPGVYCLNNETSYLSFAANLYKKWRHIVTIPFHFEINVLRVFQLAWVTIYYATLKIKGDLVIKHVTYEKYLYLPSFLMDSLKL